MLYPYTGRSASIWLALPAIWRRISRWIPSPNFGLNYDPSHLVMQLIDPSPPFAIRIADSHTHAKDMRIDRDRLNEVGSLEPPMSRSTAKIPGLGDVPWASGSCTHRRCYERPVCVEVEDEAFHDTLEGRKRSLRISHRVLTPDCVKAICSWGL